MNGPSPMRKIIVEAASQPADSPAPQGYFAYLEGQQESDRIGFGETPRKAKRELLLSQEVLATAGGASLSVWTHCGQVKLWACTAGGTSTSVVLEAWEVDAFIEQLQLGREAA